MAFTNPGQWGPDAFLNSYGPITDAEVTVPTGYTAEDDGLGNWTITGPPGKIEVTVVQPGAGASGTDLAHMFTDVRVEADDSELAEIADLARAAAPAADLTAEADEREATTLSRIKTAPTWATRTKYRVGDFFVRAGRVRQVTAEHTTGTSYNAGYDAAMSVDVQAVDTSPTWVDIWGSSEGADLYDSQGRLTLHAYQRPETGPYGESIRFFHHEADAKSMLSWWFPTDPTLAEDESTNPLKNMVWLGAHYAAQDDGEAAHGHWSIEVPDAAGDLRTRFGIDFIDHATGLPGLAKTHIYTSASDFTVPTGDGSVLRLTSGPGSAERAIEFSADGTTRGRDAAKRRWRLLVEASAEGGSDAGSDFVLRRFSDAGVALTGTALFVKRSTGNVTIGEASDNAARLALRWAGGAAHGFFAKPSASPSSGFASFVTHAFAAGDRFLDVRVQGDSNSRLRSDHNGKLEWGGNGSAVDVTLERKQANVLGLGTAHAFRTGLSATGSRPTAASVGQGSQFFDTTLNKPIWSTGSAWVDATGAAV